ncbi:hypothetical protein DFP72DRAFT_553565 [Ephemerocybe angulata]|uniref:Uncharacterized protein n=1 Tax=Ephemerocybe angulata TaxID=980116 RepID=A0A8H6M216_9AGAR|nr:hypothetical protein DFP72DRAFT_553565 [Tulosesus angulatus]
MPNSTHGRASSTHRKHRWTAQHLRTSNARLYYPNSIPSPPTYTASPRPRSSGATSRLCSSHPESAFRRTYPHPGRHAMEPCVLHNAEAMLTFIDADVALVAPLRRAQLILRSRSPSTRSTECYRSRPTRISSHRPQHQRTPSPVLSASAIHRATAPYPNAVGSGEQLNKTFEERVEIETMGGV